ncbi:hypothetical protein ER308_18140 [Egibacter rhizosphaerae]|uniref:Uncharacterized protein n=1 Tax=Egibacter rhizosphaerae TaxID=1670831 RepID=A0A411YJG5_9ACTN|nr:hypothetical protein [Egibacter rhizosphaerae]QBI21301.1 hypothetical protein ER308_18140 [Egibacter rhizosphaerae]
MGKRARVEMRRTDDALVLRDDDDEVSLPAAGIVDVDVNVPLREPRRDDSRRTITVVLQPGTVTRDRLSRGQLRRWLVADDVLDVPAHRTSGFERELAVAEPPEPQEGDGSVEPSRRWSVLHGYRRRQGRLAVLPSYGLTVMAWVMAGFIMMVAIHAPLPHPVLRVLIATLALPVFLAPVVLRWSISTQGFTRGSWRPKRGRMVVHQRWRAGEHLRLRAGMHLGSELQYGPGGAADVPMLRTHRLVAVVAGAYEDGLVPEGVELRVDRRLSRRSRRRLDTAGVPWFDLRPTRPWRREPAHVGSAGRATSA